MIFSKKYWIILICIALLIIFTLIFKNKVIIQPQNTIIINANSAETYNDVNYYDGETTYQRYCFSCHGDLEIEKSGTGIAPPLNEYGNVWKLSSNNIAKKILFGSMQQPTSKMPSFSGMLNQDQVKNIITYIIYGLPKSYITERHQILNIKNIASPPLIKGVPIDSQTSNQNADTQADDSETQSTTSSNPKE